MCQLRGGGTVEISVSPIGPDPLGRRYTIGASVNGVDCGRMMVDQSHGSNAFQCDDLPAASHDLTLIVSPTNTIGFDANDLELKFVVTRHY